MVAKGWEEGGHEGSLVDAGGQGRASGGSISGKVEVISKQNQEESEAVAGVEVITSSLESGDE